MKNKLLIELVVPDIDEKFDLFIPINKKIGNVIVLINRSIHELTNGAYVGSKKTALYNKATGKKYGVNDLVRNTDIRHGSTLILI